MIIMDGPVAYLHEGKAAVLFAGVNLKGGEFVENAKGTSTVVREMQTALKVANWGEDNRFPNNVVHQMDWYGVGKAALNWRAKLLYGNGILPGKIVGYEDGGNTQVFEPLDRNKYKPVYQLMEKRFMPRFWLEYLGDWAWFANCFPEAIFSKDGKSITGLVHQESCDTRFKQMNDNGIIESVYLSKLWGAAADQYARFDPNKAIKGLIENPKNIDQIDGKLLKAVDCVDIYDAVNSLKKIADKQVNAKGYDFKSAVLPINYPSPNKTYYQVAAWDGARLGGWIEIAVKIPAMLKVLYSKAFRLKYHIMVPVQYFHEMYGYEAWTGFTAQEKLTKKKELLKGMNEFLSGDENAYKSFTSIFDYDQQTKKEFGLVKIESVPDNTSIDKELLSNSAADLQFLIAAGCHPTLFGAGTIGTGQQRSGGSDLRESWLTTLANAQLERQVAIGEPLSLIRDYNREVGGIDEWEEDIVFKVMDTVLTTLDQGKGTKKVVS